MFAYVSEWSSVYLVIAPAKKAMFYPSDCYLIQNAKQIKNFCLLNQIEWIEAGQTAQNEVLQIV